MKPDISKAQAAKAEKYLSAQVRFRGRTMTRKEYITELISTGYLPRIIQRSLTDNEFLIRQARFELAKKESRYTLGFSNPNLPEVAYLQSLHDSIFEKISDYLLTSPGVGSFLINKTEYDFALTISPSSH